MNKSQQDRRAFARDCIRKYKQFFEAEEANLIAEYNDLPEDADEETVNFLLGQIAFCQRELSTLPPLDTDPTERKEGSTDE